MTLPAPYPWFGGKRKVAQLVWDAFGEVSNYVEPFFGSGAVLLGRPDFDPAHPPIETINDADGFVANFWRALQADPDAVAYWADYPVNEIDLHARHGWLVNRRGRLTWSLDDPDFCDPKIAGWWLWGICSWIGSGWCSGAGRWRSNGAEITDSRQLPHLGDAGMGINRKLPHLCNARGMGINCHGSGQRVSDYLAALAERTRSVRVCCGDWSRIVGHTSTTKHGTTAVFLDPPYSDEADRAKVYATDCGVVAHEVREWCRENGDHPDLRIVLCGYDGEHDSLGWRVVEWKARGGYGSQGGDNGRGRANAKRERLWLSPNCRGAEAQAGLFAGMTTHEAAAAP